MMETKQKIIPPIIYQIEDNEKALVKFEKQLISANSDEKKIILEYPTVYIHNYPELDQYEVYIGESYNVVKRTRQHLEAANNEDNWQRILKNKSAKLFIIGHAHFNKSLTLDIENRLMLYMSSVEKVRKIYNRRGNQQNNYYTAEEFEDIFKGIWQGLGDKNPDLFPNESLILDSAIYKASPLHKLTPE
jgi:hypothetical protein